MLRLRLWAMYLPNSRARHQARGCEQPGDATSRRCRLHFGEKTHSMCFSHLHFPCLPLRSIIEFVLMPNPTQMSLSLRVTWPHLRDCHGLIAACDTSRCAITRNRVLRFLLCIAVAHKNKC